MDYEVTIKVKVDADFFYWGADVHERQGTMSEMIHNALHDLDDVNVKAIRTEEVEV
tara:strand:- start:188 stop:355 length:168 start_codon:yes stop_codon:yes gene_type:complete